MKQSIKILIGAFATIGVVAVGAISRGGVSEPIAKITPVQAMKAAEAKTGGKATLAIFEFDEGHWIYGVVVVKNHKLTEVDVDPVTGKAGATEAVTPDDEAKEMKDALAKMTK